MTGRQGTQTDYRTYIASFEWKQRRRDALIRSMRHRAPCCEVCGRPGIAHKNSRSSLDYQDRTTRIDDANGLEVHHLSYERLGCEQPDDLIVLCTDVLYYEDHDQRCREAMRAGASLPPIPEHVGCHERAHIDRVFRAAVARIAASRR